MKNKNTILYILSLAFFVLIANAGAAHAQPSTAQLKKLFTIPGAVSVVVHKPGKREWSSTYKKYVWNVWFTVKRKTETPGVFVTVKGYSSFDIVGGKYIYWRDFISENTYDGQKNPTVAEINQALTTGDLRDFNYNGNVIGEYESMKLSAEPDWEWHTQNSVSFNVAAVFYLTDRGRYGSESWYSPPTGFKAVDRVESALRIRLYRDGANLPWRGINVSDRIPTFVGSNTIEERIKLLERKELSEAEFRQRAKMTKIPILTQ